MIIYSSIYYLMFLSALLLLDVIFLVITIRAKQTCSVFFAVQVQFFCVIGYEFFREWMVIQHGAAYPLTFARVNILNIEYFIYGVFIDRVIAYVEKNWRKALRNDS